MSYFIKQFSYLFIFINIVFISPLSAEINVQDDEGNSVILIKPANRIISMAPHITEILFSAGAAKQIIAAVKYSDYPEAAKNIPRIDGYPFMDIEKIISLKPDLVVLWASGNNREQAKKLMDLGVTVYMSEPKTPVDIYKTIKRFGRLANTTDFSSQSAEKFIKNYNLLKKKYSNKKNVNVFYQFWNKPLMSVNGQHIISNIIELCGGTNVFSNLHSITPIISIEAVIASTADVIIAGGDNKRKNQWISEWTPWLHLTAVNKEHIYFIHPDIISRMGPRILLGAEQICEILENVRGR